MNNENLKNVVQSMKNYSAAYYEASELLKRVKKEIREMYKEPTASNKLYDAKKSYNNTIEQLKTKEINFVNNIFYQIKKDIEKAIEKPVPSEFVNTLEVLKTLGSSITENEANAYLNKYSDNYTALRGLFNILKSNGKIARLSIISLDDIIKRVEKTHEMTLDFFRNGPNAYDSRVVISENGPLFELDVYLKDFLDGHYIVNNIK